MGLFKFFIDHNYRFSQYPSCDHLNCALNILLQNPKGHRVAIEEICYAIVKANGYFYDHIKDKLNEHGFARFIK